MTATVAVLRQARARTIEGGEVRFVTVAPRKFFGAEPYNVYGRAVMISSPAKTLVDCLDRPELAGGPAELARITHAAMGAVDPAALVDAALTMKSVALLQRLGFLADAVERPLPEDMRARLRDAIPQSARSSFGRRERRTGDIGYVAAWGLFVNARREDLLAEVPRLRAGREA
jgi:predicted transcriptional regulator of viral defense system